MISIPDVVNVLKLKTIQFVFCCFSAQNAEFRSKRIDRLGDNIICMSDWSDMPFCGIKLTAKI
jgi:hypothetical protein